ncbi:class I SAM-dependent methyltransferase [Nostoc sp. FACHB-888]|uniref:class I SAM-dependent methyltransferase n=1 Tax=Nostoc sp. FACHB-888 TaxID=2692842 RepID=UPI001685F669|nr:class I SAM-dependent methyltransferase [Nostoc sp. FACHB-888]MBD2244419.1 class I SAM-dependent methyltransferase [Nostoc sp. FACHB-888]
MTSSIPKDIKIHTPLVGDVNKKSRITYQASRTALAGFNGIVMAAAEAYINGLKIPDPLLKILLNLSIQISYKYFPSLLVPYEWLLQESDRLAEGSHELMKVQYNLPEEMFSLMLKETELLYPKYSMALWEKGASNLEQAQMDMLDDLIAKAGIEDGDEILDLGCGWGSASNYILSRFPRVKVTAVNLSHQQCEYMRRKMQDPNSYLSSDRFTLYEEDFNDINLETKFDKIMTIGVFEHVGNLTKSFTKLASILKEDGKILIHIITTKLPYNITHPFINKYIFPNMRVWNYDVIPKINRDLKTINQWYLNGANYSNTLSNWLINFDQNQAKIKDLNYGMNYSKFCRMWRLYLLLCIQYFDGCNGEILGNGQYLLVRT